MRRRDFIKGIAGTATAWPLSARAQKATGEIQRVGIIDDSLSWEPFRQQLRDLHYVEGQNLTYVYLRTDGSPAQLDAAAMALAQLPVNVIVAFGTPRAKAAQRATKTIPIVAISISDPIGSGLVTSLATSPEIPFSVRILSLKNCRFLRMRFQRWGALPTFGIPRIRPLPIFWRICAKRCRYFI